MVKPLLLDFKNYDLATDILVHIVFVIFRERYK
jgi:hypothetical protein